MKQLADKPFVIIGVNSDENLEALRETVKEKNLTWRSFQNDKGVDGVIADNWAIKGWPTMFILDEKGTIRWTGHGGDIDKVITELLGEMGHEVNIVHEEEEGDEGHDDDADAEKSGDDSKGDDSKGDGGKGDDAKGDDGKKDGDGGR